MRILVLNYEYPPLGGGAAVATAAVAQGLAERAVQVDVVTGGTGTAAERCTPESGHECFEHPGLRVFRVRSSRTGVHQAGMGDAASYLIAALPLIRQLMRTHVRRDPRLLLTPDRRAPSAPGPARHPGGGLAERL
jgi:hypothetical protein